LQTVKGWLHLPYLLSTTLGKGPEPFAEEPVPQWQLILYLIEGGGRTWFDMFRSLLKRAHTKLEVGPRIAKRSGSQKASLKRLV